MNHKTPLALIELSILLVVFVLAALLCIQAFLRADAISAESAARDRAWLTLQTAAEIIHADHGSFSRACEQLGGVCSQDVWTVGYDQNWQTGGSADVYILHAERIPEDMDNMGMARLTIRTADAELAALQIGWQEEAYAEE